MKKLSIISFLLILSSSDTFSQSGWFQMPSPTSAFIQTSYFNSVDIGFIGTDSGKVFKTTNGGINWHTVGTPPTRSITKIIFVNPNTGYIICYTPTNNDDVFKTTNMGLNWNVVNTPYNAFPNDIHFINPDTGFIANNSNIIKTTNGGETWDTTRAEQNAFIDYIGVHFINSQTGFVVGCYQIPPYLLNKVIWMTINGGQNWSRVSTLTGCGWRRISFGNYNTGYIVGSENSITKTTNGGNNWSPINLNIPNLLVYVHSLFVFNPNKVYLCGSRGAYFTINGGTNWFQAQIPFKTYLEVSFPDTNTGYIVGEQGSIYKTTNGGVTIGINLLSEDIPTQFSLHQNYPNPFNPATKIKFGIPNQSNANIIIYDLLGREVATLVNEQLKPGSYSVDWDGTDFASGVYFYSLVTNDFIETKRMVLLK